MNNVDKQSGKTALISAFFDYIFVFKKAEWKVEMTTMFATYGSRML